MKYKKYLIVILLLIVANFIMAKGSNADRPKIGLVLSGGGARGLAHIGVLKVLEELDIKPDYITGTSMGSIIGGLYAIGYDSKELEKILMNQDWETLILDTITRSDVSIEEKEYVERYVGELPVVNYKLVLPSGIVDGQHISKLLTDLTLSAQDVSDFNELWIPFRCIATDLETGDAVVLDHGFLPDALRASMSIPSAFSPIKIDGKLLIDGGLARNLPVSDVIDMGADIVIAVDVSSELYKKEQLNTLVKVMEQSINFRGIESSKQEQKLADILIVPNLGKYSIIDFSHCDSLVYAGEVSARNSYNSLKQISDEQKKYEREERGIPLLKVENFHVNKIRVEGLKIVSKNLIIGKMKINENTDITFEQLSDAIDRLYGSRFFERVTYRLLPSPKGVDIELIVVENSHHVFNFSFQYNSETKSAVLLNETKRNLFIEGSRIIMDLKLNENPGGAASYFVHTGWKPGFGIGTSLDYREIEIPIKRDNQYDHYEFGKFSANFVLQTVFINDSAFGIGVQKDFCNYRSLDFETVQKYKLDAMKSFAFFKFDSFTSKIYPTKGANVSIQYESFTNINTDLINGNYGDFQRFIYNAERYKMLNKRLSISIGASFGLIFSDSSNIPYNYKISIGGMNKEFCGILPVIGLRKAYIMSRNAIVYQNSIQYNVWRKLYINSKFNIANYSELSEQLLNFDNKIVSGGIALGLKTPFGLIEYTIGTNSADEDIVQYWNVGYQF